MRVLYFLILLCSFSMSGQNLGEKEYDSISQAIDKLYLLNDQSQLGEAVNKSYKILDFLKVHQDTILLTRLYSTMSYSYSELKDKEKALEYAFKTIELNEAYKDTLGLIYAYNDLGVTYLDFKDYKNAKNFYIKSFELAQIYGDSIALIYPMYNVGDVLIQGEQKYMEAAPYLLESLNVANSAVIEKNNIIYADIYNSLGIVKHKLKEYDESKMYFKKAFAISTEQNYFTGLLEHYQFQASLYRDDRNYEKSIEMMEKASIVRDTIEKRKDVTLIKRVETEYKLKDSEEKLKLILKEQVAQETLLNRSKIYNIILGFLLVLLILAIYWTYRINRKLKAAKIHAENLSKVKSNFYSEISHELRTPLYAVTELSTLLLKENVIEAHQEYLESLNFSANHLIALVNNVLELNAIESGNLKVELLDTNFKKLFLNIINSLEYALLHSENKIILDYDDNIPEQLRGDSLKLSQIMINLISNAIKFTKRGNINVVIKKIGASIEEVTLYFEVSDNGPGISEENQKNIFEAYYKEAQQSDNTFRGTGLGLSIVNRLLNVMGSQIKIESELGKGSKFYFQLPFAFSDKVKSDSKDQPVIKESLKGMHFLVVDDNRINQLVTGKILESLSITCDIVASGMEALKITKNNIYDCVLMDIHMPEMNGYQTAALIKEINSNIPIIALTAANSKEVIENVKNSAMDACVFKPFFVPDLIDTISSVIHKK